ncbi:MAG: cobalamin-binding protein [Deltaproteobacteria bacterium]|nr:cobalamin-binding protein [Deltaproteobacteria bacterium]
MGVDALLGAAPPYPRRVVCLTEETTEVLYRIGAGDRVVGVSGYTVRPKEARQKPKVSSFLDADFEKILALKPELVLGFSDLQAELGRELCKRGVPVFLFNQRSLAEILQAIRITGALVGLAAEADALAKELEANLRRHADAASKLPKRPRVFFEEWHEPLIAGIRWCSELVELVGGDDVCANLRTEQGAKGRIVDATDIAARDPEVVIASWCGRKAQEKLIRARPGWERVSAVKHDQLYEVKSTFILQPGPAALTDGVDQLAKIIAAAAHGQTLPRLRPGDLRRADGR